MHNLGEIGAMYKNILVPLDLDDATSWEKSLPTAVALCQTFGAALHVMTVLPDYTMTIVGQYFPAGAAQAAADKAFEDLNALVDKATPADLTVNTLVARGTIYQQILEAGTRLNVDLIVMGSHRPTLSDYLLGPNAAKVVRHFDKSVLVARP